MGRYLMFLLVMPGYVYIYICMSYIDMIYIYIYHIYIDRICLNISTSKPISLHASLSPKTPIPPPRQPTAPRLGLFAAARRTEAAAKAENWENLPHL